MNYKVSCKIQEKANASVKLVAMARKIKNMYCNDNNSNTEWV